MDRIARARAGCWAGFCVTGVFGATYAGRLPALADRLDLSPGDLAVAVLGIEAGALVGLPVGAALVGRVGSRASLRIGFAVFAPGLLVGGLAPSLPWLVAGLAVWAVANSVVDVALNAEGVELDRRYGRPVLSGLHAGQGVGLLLGASGATVAAASALPLLAHLGAVALLGLAIALVATRPLLRAPAPSAPVLVRPDRNVLLLGAVAFCAFLVDGGATNWIAVQLATDRRAGPGLAAAGYLVFAVAVVLSRLAGDRVAARVTRSRVVQACGLLVACGIAVVVTAPGPIPTIAGWALVGLAVGPLPPTTLGAAPSVGGLSPPAAIAAVTTVGYLGSFTGPPLVGALAGLGSLSVALSLLGLAGLAAAVLAPRCLPAGSRQPP